MTSKIVVNNIEADSGVSTVTFNSNIQGNLIGNVTGNVNSTGVTTVTSLRIGTGTSISSPATNVLTLGTNNVESVRINSSGNVGLGTTNPTSLLHLSSTTAPQLNVQAPTPGGADSQLRISSSAGNYRRIIFYDSAATPTKNNFQIAVQEVDNSLSFGPSSAVGGLTFSGSTSLNVDSSGRVTTPSQPYAIIFFNGGDTGAYNNKIGPTFTKTIPTGTISNSFSLYNSSNGRFTAPVTGLYEFGFSTNILVNTASTWINIATYKNGSVYAYHYEDKNVTNYQYIAFSDRIVLNANDYVELWMGAATGTLGFDTGTPWSLVNFRLIG